MAESTLVVRSTRVVAGGVTRPAAVHVEDGRIVAVTAPDTVSPAAGLVDYGDAVILPGLVDAHVHLNEPGRTEWEGFASGTAAAVAGGTTTVVDMPLNCIPPTTTAEALRTKREAAAPQLASDVALWGGLVPDNLGELPGLVRAGVRGFKAFMIDSGVPEFPAVSLAQLDAAMPVIAELGSHLIVHAELAEPMAGPQTEFAGLAPDCRLEYAAYAASRPPVAERAAVEALVEMVGRHGTRTHVLHVSAASVLPVIAGAQNEGLPITAETCPHYLFFDSSEIPDGATSFKCAPPIRSAGNRERLWQGLRDGVLGMVVSDHSPSPPEVKALETGDFAGAWGGISSIQLRLSAVWTAGRSRGVDFVDLARWLAEAPARLAGLSSKGTIAAGKDADLVVWDPEVEWDVDPARLLHRHPITPYAGRRLSGAVTATYLRGEVVYDGSRVRAGHGRLIPT